MVSNIGNTSRRIFNTLFTLILASLFCNTANAGFTAPYLVKDIVVGTQSSSPTSFANLNGVLFFSAASGMGSGLWRSDGTTEGTILVKQISPPDSGIPSELIAFQGALFFRADNGVVGTELWKSDGTDAGTMLLKDLRNGAVGSGAGNFTIVGNNLFFTAIDTVGGAELWKSDGTKSGTVVVKDINLGSEGSSPRNLTNIDGVLFFNADDGINGRELWLSDGTPDGTVLVKDINTTGSSIDTRETVFTNFDGELFFSASDDSNGLELWKSDGTSNGTTLVENIAPDSTGSSPASLAKFDQSLFFTAFNGTQRTLWQTDGNITLEIDTPGNNIIFPSFNELVVAGEDLFFKADQATSVGVELFKLNRSTQAITLVKDINSASTSSVIANLFEFENTLFFRANNGVVGTELWASDGTSDGTALVADINPGTALSNPSGFYALGDTLFFNASTDAQGEELWALNVRQEDLCIPIRANNGKVAVVCL